MEPSRTTISLGPLEISFRRDDEGPRFGLPGSVLAHVLVIALAMLISTHKREVQKEEAAKPRQAPVPITFVNPLPPLPKPPPQPQAMDMHKPPPAPTAKPLRMEPVPEVRAALRDQASKPATRDSGQRDTKPAGGEQGGPLARPTPGVPELQPSDPSGSRPDEPRDLQGRLQDFRRALEQPRPSTPKGPKGGGSGSGGVTMPNLPATGFGVGNLQFESTDYDWGDYGREIHGIIWREWHRRLLATSSVFERWGFEHHINMLDHENRVRFTILRSGQVVDVGVETASGCFPLDASATDALKQVVLPPLPSDFTRESETVHARFIAEGQIQGMGTFLQQLRAQCTCF
jgi:outer membrane biosynthesis protein TonB